MSKVIEVRYDRFLALGEGRASAARRPVTAGGAPERGPLLLGALSLDIYLGRDLVLPGGGVLNMAWRWRRSGVPFRLSRGSATTGLRFPRLPRPPRHPPPGAGLGAGPSASIDIVIQPDLQPWMDNFVEGVWATSGCSPTRSARGRAAGGSTSCWSRASIPRAAAARRGRAHAGPRGSRPTSSPSATTRSSGSPDTMADVDIGFVGWPGEPDDPTVAGIRGVAHDQGRLVVVTFGSARRAGVDGRDGARATCSCP